MSVSTDASSGSEGVSTSLPSVSARNTKAVIKKQGANKRVVRNASLPNDSGEQSFIGEGDNRYEVLLLLGQGSFGKVIHHPIRDATQQISIAFVQNLMCFHVL